MDFSIQLDTGSYPDFLAAIAASTLTTDQKTIDANNGWFEDSAYKFTYVYNPTAGLLYVTVSNLRGPSAFHSVDDATNYFYDVLEAN